MVDLYIGEAKTHFRVHESTLCKIPYFEKMFRGGFNEAQTKEATFPEDPEECFDVLIEWLYTGKLRSLGNQNTASWPYITTYALADKLYLTLLMDEIATAYILWLKGKSIKPSIENIGRIYIKTSQGSPLRKFACWSLHYIVARHQKPKDLVHWPNDSIQELLSDHPDLLSNYLKALRSHPDQTTVKNPTKEVPLCTFHHHADGEPCVFKD